MENTRNIISDEEIMLQYSNIIEPPTYLLAAKCEAPYHMQGCTVGGVDGYGCCKSYSDCLYCNPSPND